MNVAPTDRLPPLPPQAATDAARVHALLSAAPPSDAEIVRLRAELSDAWIPVGERLPALQELVFALSNSKLSVMARDDLGEDGWLWAQQHSAWNLADPDGLEIDDDYQPTHWRPMFALPDASQPQAEGG